MTPLIKKLQEVRREINGERGIFYLFAAVAREELPDRWDILIAAPWVDPNQRESYDYVITKLQRLLSPKELIQISGVIFPDLNTEWVQTLSHTFRAGNGMVHASHLTVENIALRDVYILDGNPVPSKSVA